MKYRGVFGIWPADRSNFFPDDFFAKALKSTPLLNSLCIQISKYYLAAMLNKTTVSVLDFRHILPCDFLSLGMFKTVLAPV